MIIIMILSFTKTSSCYARPILLLALAAVSLASGVSVRRRLKWACPTCTVNNDDDSANQCWVCATTIDPHARQQLIQAYENAQNGLHELGERTYTEDDCYKATSNKYEVKYKSATSPEAIGMFTKPRSEVQVLGEQFIEKVTKKNGENVSEFKKFLKVKFTEKNITKECWVVQCRGPSPTEFDEDRWIRDEEPMHVSLPVRPDPLTPTERLAALSNPSSSCEEPSREPEQPSQQEEVSAPGSTVTAAPVDNLDLDAPQPEEEHKIPEVQMQQPPSSESRDSTPLPSPTSTKSSQGSPLSSPTAPTPFDPEPLALEPKLEPAEEAAPLFLEPKLEPTEEVQVASSNPASAENASPEPQKSRAIQPKDERVLGGTQGERSAKSSTCKWWCTIL